MLSVLKSRSIYTRVFVLLVLATAVLSGSAAAGTKKKKEDASVQKPTRVATMADFDLSKIVFPNPPAIARIRMLDYYAGMKIEYDKKKIKPKTSWMDRLAGDRPMTEDPNVKIPYQLITPYGMAFDSKGQLYIADTRVGAIFIVNMETKATELIRNKSEANFSQIYGLAIDDDDRLFVSDGGFHHVLVFNPEHKVTDIISEGLKNPIGLAIDRENRLLYVCDSELDQVLVYNADSLKLIRKIGTTGHNHELTTPGDFSYPSNAAVDKDGNLYVSDGLNDRVEIFDADGNFISAIGKNCDAPGCFQRPKGIAVDSDGHIWAVDTLQSKVKVFDRDGRLLIYLGGYGKLPAQFVDVMGIAIDNKNRVYVADQHPGRIQIFRYVTDAEAEAEKDRREQERLKKAEQAKDSAAK